MGITESGCIFCSIIHRAIPAKIIAENETVMAFHDLHAVAPHHVLVVPKTHIASVNELTEHTAPVMADIALMAKHVASKLAIDHLGYRFVINTGRTAGQSVFHLHGHVLGGRDFSWPPG